MTTTSGLVALSGALHEPSRASTLVSAIADEVGRVTGLTASLVKLGECGRDIGSALDRSELSDAAHAILDRIERADVLVVGTPVYRASYTGILKHLVDLIDQKALRGTPVLVAATGGSDHHSLVIEHGMKPLFAFFQAAVLPVGVYARGDEIVDGLPSEALRVRISDAVEAGKALLPDVQNL